jgi:DamX protein
MSVASASNQLNNTQADVTKINAVARVDYVLRFNHHPAVIMAASRDNYQQTFSDYLEQIAVNHNVALLQATPKLTNIQCRCRIVEQLFSHALFDPEQPLYKTLIPLATQSKEVLNIVIEHGQYLTLQMLHELCQLTEQAQKQQLLVHVAIFGDKSLVNHIVENKAVLAKRLSLIDAENGQLLTWTLLPLSVKFQWNHNVLKAVVVGLSLFLAVIMYWQLSFNQPQIQQDGKKVTTLSSAAPIVTIKPQGDLIKKTPKEIQAMSQPNESTLPPEDLKSETQIATPDDVISALMGKDTMVFQQPEIATPSDIASALLVFNQLSEKTVLNAPKTANRAEPVNRQSVAYYQQFQQGYVVQLAGFYHRSEYEQFIQRFSTVEYHQYYKKINEKPYLVLTSAVVDSREQAQQLLQALPQQMQVTSPWIRSISDVKKEIAPNIVDILP